MSYTIKKHKIWIALLLVGVSTLLGVSIILFPPLVAAQEPLGYEAGPPEPLDREALAPFDAYASALRAQRIAPFDIQVVKNPYPSVTQVNSGSIVTFRVTITNKSLVNPAIGVMFQDDFPEQMTQVKYQINATNVISNNQAKPVWLFLDPIPPNSRVVMTITSRLVSQFTVDIVNKAKVWTFTSGVDPNLANNEWDVPIKLIGSNPGAVGGPVYLPLLFKNPQPIILLAYHENFNDEDDAWQEFTTSTCSTENRDDRFWVTVEASENSCLPPAQNEDKPEEPYRTYGEFEVTAYFSEGDGNVSYGIFINGEGGDNYYLFRIWPNDSCSDGGRWQLIRREDGNNTTLLDGSCSSLIREDDGVNTLRIAHSQDRKLTVYVNGSVLSSYTDNSGDHLTGEATGVYVRSDDEEVLVKFDDFKVYRYTIN
jgi:uncharacterized repeat protein (TIGR01451 family)